MQQWKRVGTALATLAFSASLFAQASKPEASAPLEGHLYVGGGGGQASWSPGCPSASANCDDSGRSVHGFAGWQLNNHWAGEIAFTNLGMATGGSVQSEVRGKAWEISAVGAYPVRGILSLIGRAGMARVVLKGGAALAGHSATNYYYTVGLGAQAEFTPNFIGRFEWQTFPGRGDSNVINTDVNIFSVSAGWRFR